VERDLFSSALTAASAVHGVTLLAAPTDSIVINTSNVEMQHMDRLEYLGDSVLKMLVTVHLVSQYKQGTTICDRTTSRTALVHCSD